ncbi:outer membrane protein [Chryseobacterium koreense]|uniref:outer membrane protein n=1 Tax=Chryseobacterium koreense TaxID=232216 RepID=UPI0026F35661|nr:outer membrane beta-barrel protein [Chryseobacterium koreense]
MKKLLVVSAVALFASMSAQETSNEGFAKGSTFVTGAVGFNSVKTGNVKENNFTISPSVGYFVTSNIALGARIGYNNLTKDNGTRKATVDTFTAGVFGRYYWMPASKFSVFAELGADYANSSYDSGVAGSQKSKANGFGVEFAPGISYFLSNNFALESKVGVLGYNSVKPDATGAESTDSFNFGLNLNDIKLGLVYKF